MHLMKNANLILKESSLIPIGIPFRKIDIKNERFYELHGSSNICLSA